MAAEVVLGLAQLLGMDSPAAQGAPHPGAYIIPDESILEALGAMFVLLVCLRSLNLPTPLETQK